MKGTKENLNKSIETNSYVKSNAAVCSSFFLYVPCFSAKPCIIHTFTFAHKNTDGWWDENETKAHSQRVITDKIAATSLVHIIESS